VRFLVDRCAGRRLAEWLGSQGHDVLESRTLGPDPGDLKLLQWATSEERVLVTLDADFPKLVFLGREEHAGIVRLPDVPASSRIALLAEVLERHTPELEAGSIITVSQAKIRITRRGA
jgi:predicted nuclease of predicted toxin-antitoxin system